MKRSKKAGGYNLRKSLAWDRAFLAEEGVLNDSELSMISGCDIDRLCAIDEQGSDLLPTQSGTTHGSSDVENLKEDLSSKSPSDYPNKRNAINCSFMKQEFKNGGSLASVSNSAQKVSPGHGLKKTVYKEVFSSPMASTSEKRVLNSTKKLLTRNSKIPKVQVSKKNPPVRSMTAIQSAAGGSSLKSSGIPQPAARKFLSSKLSSNIKHASSDAKRSSESTPKSIKPYADFGNDVTNSTLHSLMSHKAPHTTKGSKHLENKSKKGLLTAGADTVKSSEQTSSTAALSHVQTDNAGLDMKNTEVQGNKPSGLRMPSPSLRFFSETKSSVSNISSQTNSMPHRVLKSCIPTSRVPKVLKSSIPTSRNKVLDHTSDSKPVQISQAHIIDQSGKAESSSQGTDKYSASSIAAPKVHAKVVRDKWNEQEVENGTPLGHGNCSLTNNEQFRYDNLDGFDMQYKAQVRSSFKVKEQDSKDNRPISSHAVSKESAYKEPIHFQENRTAHTHMLDGFGESCPEVQLIAACERNREVQLQLIEEIEYNSAVTNDDAVCEPQTTTTSHQNILMLAPDVDSSSSILDDVRTPGERSSCSLDQVSSERSMEVHLDEIFLFADGNISGKLEEDNCAVPGCAGVMAVHQSKISDEATKISNGNFIVAGHSMCEHVEDEQGDIMFDSKLSNMKLNKSSEAQHKVIENLDAWKRNSTDFNNYDDKDICTVSLEVGELSSHCASALPEVSNENSVEFYHMCKLGQGEQKPQVSRHVVVENCASADNASIAYEQCSEVTEDTCTEVDKPQILSNEADLNHSIRAQSSFYETNQGEMNSRVSDDLCKVNNRVEEVKGQIDLLSHLLNSNHQATHLAFQSSGMRSQDQVVIAVNEPAEELLCPLNEHVTPPRYELDGATLEEYIELDKLGCNLAPRETDENTCSTEGIHDGGAIMKQTTYDQMLTRPPPTAVPFSDEWLAAIESAGEEILTLKTGAVKHSPPDKSIPEPSPWSPVKRKTHQLIGPFDCTKYTNS